MGRDRRGGRGKVTEASLGARCGDAGLADQHVFFRFCIHDRRRLIFAVARKPPAAAQGAGRAMDLFPEEFG